MAELLECVERQAGEDAALTVVLLHGLGADGHDFVPIVPELRLPFGVRFVFPHAPVRPVTINGGLAMRAWYDIYGFGPGSPEDAAGLEKSAAHVRALLDREIARGQPEERIVLAGFSQGGAVALHTALRSARGVAGVIALSTYLPLAREAPPARPGLPVFMAHGTADPIIPLMLAEASRDLLAARGCTVRWRSYAMAHSVCPEEVRDIADWLVELRAAVDAAPPGR